VNISGNVLTKHDPKKPDIVFGYRFMALRKIFNATSIEGAANICEYCWYCLEGV